MRRAAHQILDRPLVLDDPIALRIVGHRAEAAIRSDPRHYQSGFARSLRWFLVARNRYAEDALAAGVAAGVRQYVVLGAGLDTFAYRNPYPALRVVEVDHPVTQAWKRQRLVDAHIAVPEGVTFAAGGLSAEPPPPALLAAG